MNPLLDPFVLGAFCGEYRFPWESLRCYHDQRLRRLVRHAWRNVPFYRELYDEAGVDVAAFRGVQDLEKLPVVTRSQLQQAAIENRVARGIEPGSLLIRKTSGSSGMPLTIPRSRWEDLLLQASRVPARRAAGVRAWHRRAQVSLVKRIQTGGVRQFPPTGQRGGLFPFRTFDAFLDPDELARQIAAYRPDLLTGDPGFLERLCLSAQPGLIERIRPARVMAGGETLQPGVRRLIEEAFEAPVFDVYGAHEFNLVAWQRELGGCFEVASLVTLGEVLCPDGGRGGNARVAQGQHGEFVGTAMWSYASPFIRYRLGDDVTLAEADPATGVARTLGPIQGRVTDRFVTREGGTIHAYQAVTPLLTAMPWLRSYQMEQNRAGELLVRVVAGDDVSPERLAVATAELAESLKAMLRVEVEPAGQLLREGNAKKRLFIRNVPLPPSRV